MAYTLKSAWTSRAVACVAVDQDGSTIKDFVTGNTMTPNVNVTVGSATFKGVSRPYFQTKANGTFDFYGLTWSGSKPNQNYDPNFSIICLLNSYTSGAWLLSNNAGTHAVQLTSGKLKYQASPSMAANTALATSTKLGFMGIFRRGGTCEWHYVLESGSMSQDFGGTDTFNPNDVDLTSFGGFGGQGNFVANNHLFLMTNDVISNTDRDNIFSDFVGELFDTSATNNIPAIMHHRRMMGMS